MKKPLIAVGLGMVALAYAARGKIGEVTLSFDTRVEGVRRSLRTWGSSFGLDPDWTDALGKVEGPNWDLRAINLSGPDGARGGAYGPTQITEKTARAYGYTGPMTDFQVDPELVGQWTALIAKAGNPVEFKDLCAWWNAGHPRFAELPADHKTVRIYYPKAVDALIYVQNHPIAMEETPNVA